MTQNFPKILKVSRILPINKPQLDRSDIMSYRPINNLSCVEKVIEAYFLHHLEKFQEKNSLFHKNLHGGRKKHSTVTAITQIYDKLYYNENKQLNSILWATDLSAAYDTIDIPILLQKMDHYGIRGKYNALFKSYFEDRQQFVRLDNANSSLRPSPYCSVIQGSRISSWMFNAYCNEIPLLPNLIDTDILIF